MKFSILFPRLALAALSMVMASCGGTGVTATNPAAIAKFRVAPTSGSDINYSVHSMGGPDLVAGALPQLALEIDRMNFEKVHGAGLRSISQNLPQDLVPKVDRRLRSKLQSTGRVTTTGGGLLRVEVEQVGVLSPPNPVGTNSGMLVNPFIIAKVTIEDPSGRVVVQDRILGLGETAGYKGITYARQYLKGTKRKSLPFLHPKTGKSASTYGANPALLRRDFDSAVHALGEDLDVFLKEVYGTP